ncbi:MAG TPA: hypothetical protein VFV49_14620 [Thermoanaerobaculia bacterium]|nr:hypothetical protein [Thermoanaerobaculia bacterium]
MTTIPMEPPNPHEVAVLNHIAQLRLIQDSIAGYGFIGGQRRQSLKSSAAIPDRFLEAVAAALDASLHLATSSKVTGAQLRDVIAFARAFNSLADELEIVARGLRHTIAVRRGELARLGLRAYRIARSLDLPSEAQQLVPHIKEMKRTLGRGRPNKPVPVVPAPPPVPPTPTPIAAEPTVKKAGGDR